MFEGETYLLVESARFSNVDDIKSILEAHGATKVFVKHIYSNEENYLWSSKRITHIICEETDFIEYETAITHMVPVTTPLWVTNCVNYNKLQPVKIYNPDPKYFMKDCFVCVADNLPPGDKELIYGGIAAFGGHYLDDLSKFTTHLISLDMKTEKSIIALAAVAAGAEDDSVPAIKVVLPHWIDDCFKAGKMLDEKPYLLPNPPILVNGKREPASSLDIVNLETQLSQDDQWEIPHNDDNHSKKSQASMFLESKRVFIHSDYNVSERLFKTIVDLVAKHGGIMKETFSEDDVDIYIGKYRRGKHYQSSCASKRIIVGTMEWLYSLLVSKTWKLPTNSNLLHYPVPMNPIDEFKGLKISITNYSGLARVYLSTLISIMGGSFTKSLGKDNDYLVAASQEGRKFEAASNKWSHIKVVNHYWVEDCFAKWELLDDLADPRYKYFGNESDQNVEHLLGTVKLKESILSYWYKDQASSLGNVIASNDDDGHYFLTPHSVEKSATLEFKDSDLPEEKENYTHMGSKSPETTPEDETVNGSGFRRSRSAALKAAERLHQDMSDLNSYEKAKSSKRKLDKFLSDGLQKMEPPLSPSVKKKQFLVTGDEMEEISIEIGKSKSNSDENNVDKLSKKTKTPPLAPKEVKLHAIITGCENEFTLNRNTSHKLLELGIKVLSDVPKKHIPIDTIIAPKILRTAKFLSTMATADRIIHPSFLTAVLNNHWDNWESHVDEYSLDKVLSVAEVNVELGHPEDSENQLAHLVGSNLKGKLFENSKFNLSINLNGGTDVISGILSSHGENVECKSIKNVNSSNSKQLLEDDKGQVILIASKSKDTKLIKNFKQFVEHGIVIEWDWCVKSIFLMKLQPLSDFMI
ncbi:uncharacterized protein KQ657_004465 [Scheffersomyces spartinae]|uniref:BRCT domain-containing protein n=1 Tax=Scheffersomyces spartinae TaxID=45513 RepID=A0A9P7VCG8_9ASCO|nr:uncharacterized protein KQ657_004465 [Scheffersomyces spartinae]KAG7194784.1 hypothetical protein KQ657_004465 [Scheffersomyces spartinae]